MSAAGPNLTTHVLDLARGRPARGVAVRLDRQGPGGDWEPLAEAVTDDDGRVRDFGVRIAAGVHRLTFAVGDYFRSRSTPGFHPEAPVVFEVKDATTHHHVPLLVSPFGYSTYRGS